MRDRPPEDDSEEDDVREPTEDGGSDEEDEIMTAERRDRLSLALSKMFSKFLVEHIR